MSQTGMSQPSGPSSHCRTYSGFVVLEYLRENDDSVAQFVRYGLIKPEDGSFIIGAIKDFLRSEGEQYGRSVAPFARTHIPIDFVTQHADSVVIREIVEKQVELENHLRRVILVMLGSHLAFDRGKTAEALVRGIPASAERPDPSALFVGRTIREVMSDLYLLDCKRIVEVNWDVFAGDFENKDRFSSHMEEANLARRIPAHVKTVSADESDAFKASMAWLIRRSRKVEDMLGLD